MAQHSAAAAPSSSSHPPPPPSSTSSAPMPPPSAEELHFFVKLPSRGSLVVHARLADTVGSIMERLQSVAGIPCHKQRLIYRGREMQSAFTLLHYAVEKDSVLFLTGRLRSTKHSGAWQRIDEMISSIGFLKKTNGYNGQVLRRLVKDYFKTVLACEEEDSHKIPTYFLAFVMSSVPLELVRLYLSPCTENRQAARDAITIFLGSIGDCLPGYMPFGSIVFTFCRLLGTLAGTNDPLYAEFRRRFVDLIMASNGHFWRCDRYIHELNLLVVELVDLVDAGLSSDPISVSEYDLNDLCSFLIAIRQGIEDRNDLDSPNTEHLNGLWNTEYDHGIDPLHGLFIKLLNKVTQCLKKVEDILDRDGDTNYEYDLETWQKLLLALTVVNEFSKIFEGSKQLVDSLIFEQRRVLNTLLRHIKRCHIDRLLWIMKYKDVIGFEVRLSLLLSMLPDSIGNGRMNTFEIDRSLLLVQSYHNIALVDPSALHGFLVMGFKNEWAFGPGVIREWLYFLCQEIFNPPHQFFLQCPYDHQRFFPNPESPVPCQYFRFIGRVIALALTHKVQVGIRFARVFFLQLAERSVTWEDVHDADPAFYRSCKAILKMDADLVDSDALGLTFATEVEVLGSKRIVELCPSGKEIIVDRTNREEYIDLLVNHRFVASISEHIAHFAEGFSDVLSNSMDKQLFFDCLNPEDFDQMLGGNSSTISVEEWKEHTDYNGYRASDDQICWFWEIVEGMSDEQRRVLLFFWISVKYLPAAGFAALSSGLLIDRTGDCQTLLPTSNTCFFALHLPAYESKSIMYEKLQFISQEHVGCSFGMD